MGRIMKYFESRITAQFQCLLIITMSLMTTYVNAIDLIVNNASISPDPITATGNYTISMDVMNNASTTTPEVASVLVLDISGYDINNVSAVVNNSPDWSCNPSGPTIDCNYTAGLFPIGAMSTLSVVVAPGTSVVNPDVFNINVSDESGATIEDNITDNMTSVTTSSGPPTNPDLGFEYAMTPSVISFNEFDTTPMMVTFRVINNGAPVSMDAFLNLTYDDIHFTLSEAGLPTGWGCFTGTGTISCNKLTFGTGEVADLVFNLAPISPAAGLYTGAVTGTLTNGLDPDADPSDNDISINVDIVALTTDYEMRLAPTQLPSIDILDNATGNIPIAFELENVGTAQGFSESVGITLNPDFALSNVMINNTGGAMWSCSSIGIDWDCINSGTGMQPGEVAMLTADIITYPSSVGTTPSAISASAFVSGDLVSTNDTSAISVNVVAAPQTDLVLSKFVKDGSGAGANIITESIVGNNFFYHIHVDNPSITAATNVVVTDPLPAGVQFSGLEPSGGWSCSADPFVNDMTPQTVTCNHPSIPASSPSFSDVIVLNVIGLTTGNKENIGFASSDEADADPSNNDNVAMPAIVNILDNDPDIIISKSILSGTSIGGGGLEAPENGQVVYQILGINNTPGSNNGTMVQITDTLPPGVSYVSSNPLGNFTCSAFDTVNNILTCDAPSLPFTTGTDGVEITVDVTGIIGTAVVNTANITASNDSNTGNNSDSSDTFTVVAGGLPDVDLSINKEALDLTNTTISDVTVGDDFKYRLSVENIGPNDAPIGSLEVNDSLPAELSFVLPLNNPPNWTCNTSVNTLTCTNDVALIAGSSASDIEFTVNATTVATGVDNSAQVEPISPAVINDTNTANNTSNVIIDINSAALPDVDISIIKDAEDITGISVTEVEVGDDFKYEFTVQSSGPNDAPIGSVEIQDTLPPEVVFDLPLNDPAGWTCNIISGNTLSCINDVPLVAGGPPFVLDFSVIAQTANPTVTNTAGVSIVSPAVINDIDASNDNGSITIAINNPAVSDLIVNKSVSAGTSNKQALANKGANQFVVGDEVIYNVSVNNNSTSVSYSDMVVRDALPSNVDFVSVVQNQGFDCNYNTGNHEVTCTNDAANQLLPSQILDVTINTVAATVGSNIANIANVSSVAQSDDVDSNDVLIDILSDTLPPTTLSITKQAIVAGQSVTSVTKGTAFSYRLDVTNTGQSDAVSVVLIDDMPPSIVIDGVQSNDWSCTNVGLQYTCELTQALTAGSSSQVEFAVRDGSAANVIELQNTASVSADNASSVSDTNTVFLTQIALDVNVSQNPEPVGVNESFEIIVDVVNTGSEPLQGISVVNTLPDGFSYPVNKRGSNCNANGQVLTCGLNGPVAVGQIGTVVLQVQALNEIEDNITYTNVTTVSGSNFPAVITNTFDINIASNNAGEVDLSMTKTASSDAVTFAEDFRYTLTVENNSKVAATGVIVNDTLPEGIILQSIEANGWNCNNDKALTCSLPMLGGNETSSIVLNVMPSNITGEVTNSAEVSAEQSDPNTANNIDEVVVTVSNAMADLALSKIASVESLTSGEPLSWSIVVTNNGPQSAENIVIEDQLPSGYSFDSVTHDGAVNCNNSSDQISCQITQLDAKATTTINVMGTVTLESGLMENTATVSTSTTDPDLSNNTGKAGVMVNPVQQQVADLSVSITNDSEVIQGNTATIDVTVLNNGPDAAASPDLDVILSGAVEQVVVNQNADWTCQVNNKNVHCDFNDQQMNNGFSSTIALVINTPDRDPGGPGGPGGPGPGHQSNITINAALSSTTGDNQLENNSAASEISVDNTPTEEEILDALTTALAGRGSPQVIRAIENVSSYCADSYDNALDGACDELYEVALDGDGETVRNVMEEITPNEVIGQSTSVAEISTAQFRNVGSRLSQLRGGGGSGFSLAGLNARYGSGSLPLGMLAYLNQSEEEADGLTKPSRDFVSPWGFFVNGTISMGERDATGRELGFDFDSYGLTAGFDYRLNSSAVIGLALGYANFDSEIDNTATLKSTGVTLTGYGSFNVNDNFYVDARISYGKPEFDQSRNINFTLGELEVNRTAIGKTDAQQYSIAMSAGYNFYKNSWNITPNASFNYVRTTIDGFTETGAGAFNFIFSEQELESLVWSAGVRVTKAISLKNGVLTPQFDIDYNYESKNNGNDIEARFILAPVDEIFFIETDSPDRTYGSAGLGLVYITSNGKQAYINYRSILGLNGFSRGTFNLGARFEF